MEALEPLRQRFNAQHYSLRKFYYECSNLKYLTGLINVPKLGQVGHFLFHCVYFSSLLSLLGTTESY
jgi:ANTH domain